MNLFLLTAVPLAAVAVHRLNHPDRAAFADPKSWIWGSVWALAALMAASYFGAWRSFGGDLVSAFFGIAFADVVLVPGVVVAAWVLTRPRRDAWELALWLALAFTMAGLRDFVSTNRTSDLYELFLVPLDRILVILALPALVLKALEAKTPVTLGLWIAAAAAMALTAPLFAVLSFAHAGWLVWLLEVAGIAALVVGERLTAFVQRTISAIRPTRP
jgi:hypothetical protein